MLLLLTLAVLVPDTGHAQAGTNLALGKSVTMSSTQAGPASLCVDGNTSTDFCQTDVSGTNGIANQWIDVDLGGDFPIQQLVLFNQGACCASTSGNIVVVAGDSSLPRPATLAAVVAQPRYYQFYLANVFGTGTFTSRTVATGLRKAAWVRIFQNNNGAATGNGRLGFSEIQVVQGTPFQRYLVNRDFEQPLFGNNTIVFGVASTRNGVVTGWSTTDQRNTFEFWTGPSGNPVPFSGHQYIELNAYTNGTVSQSICVFPDESFTWSLAHRWRPGSVAVPDIAKLSIDGADIAQFADNGQANNTSGHQCTLLGGAGAASATCATGLTNGFNSDANAWGYWVGNWSNPAANAVPKPVTFEIGAVSSSSGSTGAGNFLDDFELVGLATLVDFGGLSSSGIETIPTGNLPTLRLNGQLAAATSVQLTFGGTAVLGQHYTTSSGTGTVTVNIPAGTYDGTAATAIPLTPYVQILADGPVHSPPDTLVMTLDAFGPGLKLGDGANCTLGNNPASYTILDVPPQISIQKSTPTTSIAPNGSLTYTVAVSNTGSVDAGGTLVSDPLPAGIAAFTAWTCNASGGAVCPAASGSGAINETIAAFPPGGTVVYFISAQYTAAPPGTVLNTASANVAGGVCAPDNSAPPCTATAAISANPVIRIDKGTSSANLPPGGTATYTVSVSNVGSVSAAGTLVGDPLPAGIVGSTWTCTAFGGAVCPAASGSGAINQVIAVFPPGSRVTYSIQATVSNSPPASVTNLAQATPPGSGMCAPNGSPPPCSASVTLAPSPQIGIQKSTAATSVPVSGTIPYTLVVTNTGNVSADGTVVSDPVPFGLTGFTWTCAAAGGALCPNGSGSGAIVETIATFPPGGSVTYSIAAATSSNPPSLVTNTATADPPGDGVCAPGNSPGPCTAAVAISPVPIVSIQKSASTSTLVPGGGVTFTVVARNVSNVAADGTVITDAVPAGIAGFSSWTCSASGGAVCPAASGIGAINQAIATWPSGGEVVYIITAAVAAAPPGTVTNTASAAPSSNGVCFPNNTTPPCRAAVSISQPPRVQIQKSTTATTVTPNGTITYTVVVTNTGVSAADGTLISDPIPPGIVAFGWTCVAANGAVCPHASGTGAIGETVLTFPVNGTLTYTITATQSGNPPASITNTARATPPGQGTCSPGNTPPPCSSSAAVPPVPVLAIQKSTTSTTLTPSGTVIYLVTVTDVGGVAADGTVVSDPIPAGLTGFTWTCAASGGAVCPNANGTGAINETIATFPAGGAVSYTITAAVSATPPPSIVNTASAQPGLSGGLCAPDNSAPPCTASAPVPPGPVVELQKTTSTSMATPNGTVAYTVTAGNVGSVAADGTVINDPLPPGIAAFDWVCAGSGGAVCPNASGSGAISETIATFPVGGVLTYTITATVDAAPPGTVTNTASATLPNGGVCSPGSTASPCTASVSVPSAPIIALQKSTSATLLVPSGTITYTLVVTNAGSVSADGTTLSDPVPAGLAASSWTCAESGGAVCPNASGSGAINETIATFPAGAALTYTVSATVDASPPAAVTNSASAAPPPGSVCAPGASAPPCTADVTTPAAPQVSITKSADTTMLTPGGTVQYTITVTNTGAVAADGTPVSDAIPAGIDSQTWTCAPSGGATCAASGSGAIVDTIAAFPAGSSVAYTVTATVSANPPAVVDNTATADPPGGVCTPGNTSPPCSATVSLPSAPQVAITKTADTTVLTPGGTIQYTITISNTGAVAADGTPVVDPVPAGIASQAWTCVPSGGATCTANGSGAIVDTIATFPAGSSVAYTVTATVSANPPAVVTNTATADPPGGVCTPGNTSPPCSATVSVPPGPQVAITKTADTTVLTPGGTIQYTITISNTGAVAADGTPVTDPVPAGIASQTWTCAPGGGATCSAGGSGDIVDVIASFPPGSVVTYTVTATVSANPPANVSNTASVTPPGNGVCAPANTPPPCTGTASVPPVPQVGITKTADANTLTPAGTIHYTITVSNTGAVAADGTTVSDPLAAGIAAQTWTCAPSGGATCTANGSGAIGDTIATFPPGSFVVYTVTATVSANPPASVSNTASAGPPQGGVCTPTNTPPPCTDTAAVPPMPQVSLAKTADTDTLTPGGTIHYTIIVGNTGAVAADGTSVSDPIPAGIDAQTWTCTGNGGAVCTASGNGAVNDTIAPFPAGSFVTYTVAATVSANPPASVTNTVSANPPGGLCTPGNTAPPCTTSSTVPPVPQIGIAKTADATTLTPGGTIVYTVTVSNTGAVAADGTTVSDAIPAGITAQTWICVPSGGASCAASGSGAIDDTLAAFPAGGSAVYTVTAAVSANPPATVANTAAASPPPGGVCTPGNTSPPCVATVVTPSVPQVGIVKTASSATIAPGGTITYTITVSNPGSVAADGTTVSDPVPAGIASQTWTCTANGGASCSAGGSGAIGDTLAVFPGGSSVIYTVTATVGANPPATVNNTATAVPPGGGLCSPNLAAPPCTSTATVSSLPVIGIAKTADVDAVLAGGSIQYTVTVTNAGSVPADGTSVSDPVPAGVASQSWTCTPSGGATCAASGSGAIVDTLATFPSGAAATYTVTALVGANPPAAIVNTASSTPPASGLCAPGGTPAPCTATVTTPATAASPRISISKTADTTLLQRGGNVTYTVTVRNVGGVAVTNATITDSLPTGITAFAWTCTAAGGAACQNGSGAGAIAETIPTFPAGGSVVYSILATIAADAPTTVTNSASATPSGNVICAPSGNPPPCSATAVGTVAAPIGVAVIPSSNAWTLTLLVLCLLGAGAFVVRRRRFRDVATAAS